MDDCGSLRRDDGGFVGAVEDDVLLVVLLLDRAVFVLVLSGDCAVLLCLSFRGASLISPASLRWWSSRRPRMRRAYVGVSSCSQGAGDSLTSALWVS